MKKLIKILAKRHDRGGEVECVAWVFNEGDPLAVQENVNYGGGYTLLHRRTGLCFSIAIGVPTRAIAASKMESILALGIDWDFGTFGRMPTKRSKKWRAALDAMKTWLANQPEER